MSQAWYKCRSNFLLRIFVAFFVVFVGCNSDSKSVVESRRTRNVLLDIIDKSSAITLAEHSSINRLESDDVRPLVEYKTLVIFPEQIADLRTIVDRYSMVPDTDSPTLEMISPRHTIRFSSPDGKSDLRLHIDFKSGNRQAGVSSGVFEDLRFSRALVHHLESFFNKNGFVIHESATALD